MDIIFAPVYVKKDYKYIFYFNFHLTGFTHKTGWPYAFPGIYGGRVAGKRVL